MTEARLGLILRSGVAPTASAARGTWPRLTGAPYGMLEDVDSLVAAYGSLGYDLVELPRASVADRVHIVATFLQSAKG
jgi:hypothetical protein